MPRSYHISPRYHRRINGFAHLFGGGGARLGGRWLDIAFPVLAGEYRAATLTSVGCRRGEPR